MTRKCRGLDVRSGGVIEVSGSAVIEQVEEVIGADPSGLPVLAPGFIDIQINGYAGADYCSPAESMEAIQRSLHAQFSCGVSRCFPTVITGSPENMLGAIRNLRVAKENLPEGPAMEGFHIEGPHISPEDGPRGAHPQRWVRPPDFDEFRRWQDAAGGHVKLTTLSPEWPEAPRYIERVVGEGVVVSVGHTRATAAQIADAVRAGATLSTHLGNGVHRELPRHPNYLWDQLAEDRLNASFIVDGIHLGDAFLKVALRAKGIERSVLVTDAVMPAMCAPGPYTLGEVEVELLADESVVMRGGTRLAGSSLRMDRGVTKLMQMAGISLVEALTMATVNPARVGRVSGRQRGLNPGDRMDLVLFDYDEKARSIAVRETWVGGSRVYAA